MVITIVLAAFAALALWVGGYLVGAGRGWRAREALHEQLDAALEKATRPAPAPAMPVEPPAPPPLPPTPTQPAFDAATIRAAIREEFAHHRSPEDFGEAIARLPVGVGARGGLSPLLDTIAEIGGFTTVLLSDEIGLPLAASGGGSDVDSLAGVSSLLLTLADRVSDIGAPVPIAVTVQDVANRVLVHRIFRVGEERYLLTAVAHGRHVPPTMLDPAIGRIERLLEGAPVAAEDARA